MTDTTTPSRAPRLLLGPDDIRWPFTTGFSPLAEEVAAHGTRWVERFGLAASPAAQNRFRQARTGWLTAATYPEAGQTLLCCAHDWMVWLIAFDDEFDESGVGRDADRGRAVTDRMHGVLAGTAVPDGSPAAVALRDLSGRLRDVGGPRWTARFLRHVDEYFRSYDWEARNRAAGTVPTEEEYLEQRLHTGAVQTCFDLVQPALGLDTELDLWDTAALRGMEVSASQVISLTNDLVSYPKERARGDFHNLVAIHRERGSLDVPDAVALVLDRIHGFLASFESAAAALRTTGTAVDRAGAARYADGLRAWMRGNHDWSLRSARFTDVDSSPAGLAPAHLGDILDHRAGPAAGRHHA
ncbi:hypothetical protein [Streptomyces sp. NPDC005805]|uniref:terpene synthase family protein n=1 Tax=Streptomyces sp. NPDC005805 TaxID=3157068 RepID=UPI00340C6D8D